MIALRFAGAHPASVAAAEGERLLDVAQRCGQPLEGTCGGDMACATCHVVLDPESFGRVAPASEAEEALLDFVPAATRFSRLACQLRVTPTLAGAIVTVA